MKFKMRTKSIALLTALVLTSSSLFGCGTSNEPKKQDTKSESQTSNESDKKDSKREVSSETVEITDHSGRTVEIPSPDKLKKVYFLSPIGLIFAYTMNPDKLAGTPYKVSPDQIKYMPKLGELEELGGMQMGGEINKEAIIKSGTQLILSIGPMPVNEKSKSDADELQEQIGIPVVVVTGQFEEVEKTYELLGKIYGEEKRAKELADYCKNTLKEIDEKLKDVTEDEKTKVYYAEAQDGLSTEPVGSGHSVVLEHAKAKNVANIEAKQGSGMTPVSIEQVIEWNPQLILSWSDQKGGAYSMIKEDAAWAEIDAVKNGEIYTTPDHPFTWIDRPPSVNRFLGVQWLANLLHPDKYDKDIVKTTQEFCKKFYDVELSEEDAKEILKTSIKN